MIIVNILSAFFLFFLGFIVKRFKLSFLIAGYNTSSKEERDTYDEKKLVAVIGNMLMFSASILCLPLLLILFYPNLLSLIFRLSWLLFTTFIIVFVFYINIKNKIVKKK